MWIFWTNTSRRIFLHIDVRNYISATSIILSRLALWSSTYLHFLPYFCTFPCKAFSYSILFACQLVKTTQPSTAQANSFFHHTIFFLSSMYSKDAHSSIPTFLGFMLVFCPMSPHHFPQSFLNDYPTCSFLICAESHFNQNELVYSGFPRSIESTEKDWIVKAVFKTLKKCWIWPKLYIEYWKRMEITNLFKFCFFTADDSFADVLRCVHNWKFVKMKLSEGITVFSCTIDKAWKMDFENVLGAW